jgi:hypothetical protein
VSSSVQDGCQLGCESFFGAFGKIPGLRSVRFSSLVLSHRTVVTVVTVLLAGSGSVSFAVTVAVLLNPPADVGLTRIRRTAGSPSLISPILQVTMLPEREQPDEAETKFTFAGRVSVTITPVTSEGPRFLTRIL